MPDPNSQNSTVTTNDVLVLDRTSRKVTFSLIVLLKVYVAAGAFIFCALEQENEAGTIARLRELYQNITTDLKNTNCSNSTKLLDTFHEFLRLNGQYSEMEGLKGTQPKWNFEGAFFFSYTVVTTIGYGRIAPLTTVGRLICVLYGLIGIPLCFTVLHQLSVYSRHCAIWIRLGASVKRHRFWVILIYLAAGVVLIYIPSVLISYEEGWTYPDSVYYVFVTVFTVGFGDLIAGQKADSIPLYRYFLSVWFLLGIAYMTSVVQFVRGLDTRFVDYLTTKVYIRSHRIEKKKLTQPSALSSNDNEKVWAVKVQ